MAFVLVQHLDPNRESILPELLAGSTPMPVRRRSGRHGPEGRPRLRHPAQRHRDGGRLAPAGCAAAGLPRLFMPWITCSVRWPDDGPPRHRRDPFGGRHRRALGMQAIKEVDGITFAQDERPRRTTACPAAPSSAAAWTTCCLPTASPGSCRGSAAIPIWPRTPMPASSCSRPGRARDPADLRLLRGPAASISAATSGTPSSAGSAAGWGCCRIEHMADYVRKLQDEPEELGTLYQDFLIRVTSFFRDPPAFDLLRDRSFPPDPRPSPDQPIRIWVVGCATGEEVYSVAIVARRGAGRSTLPAPRSRSWRPTSTSGRWRSRGPGSTSRISPRTSRRSACGASSRRLTGVTRSARHIGIYAYSRGTTSPATRLSPGST